MSELFLSRGSTSRGMYLSQDGGATWNSNYSAPFDPDEVLIYPSDPGILYGAGYSGVMKSTDGGLNWVEINTNLTGTYFENLAVDPTESDVVYVTNDSRTLFQSTDGGDNWATKSLTGYTDSQIYALLIDPANNALLYALVFPRRRRRDPGGGSHCDRCGRHFWRWGE